MISSFFFFFCSWQTQNGPHMEKGGKKTEETQNICILFSPNTNLWNNEFGQKKSAQPVLLLAVLIMIDIIYHSRLWYLGKYILPFLVSIFPPVTVGRKNKMRCLGLSKPDAVTKVILSKLSLWNMKKNSNVMFAIANVILIPNPDRDKCVWVSLFLCTRSHFLIFFLLTLFLSLLLTYSLWWKKVQYFTVPID